MLVCTNLLLIPAVIAWEWSVFDIVLLYWAENVMIGLFNVMRMFICAPPPPEQRVSIRGNRFPATSDQVQWARRAHHASKLFFIPFFMVHYGGFCYAHGVFVLALVGQGEATSLTNALYLLTPAMLVAIALLTASHGFSFITNFLLGGEYRHSNVAALMFRPYGRIVALHITILLGALMVEWMGSPLGLLAVLVLAKTAADLGLHGAEREKLG